MTRGPNLCSDAGSVRRKTSVQVVHTFPYDQQRSEKWQTTLGHRFRWLNDQEVGRVLCVTLILHSILTLEE